MFDDLYSRLTSRVDYRLLTVIPVVWTVLAVIFLVNNGLTYGLEFQGGTWIEIVLDEPVRGDVVDGIMAELDEYGLTGLKVYTGREIASGQDKLIIVTTSVVSEREINSILQEYLGKLSVVDTAQTILSEKPPADFMDKLKSRFKRYNVKLDENKLTVSGLDLSKPDLESAVEYYTGEKVEFTMEERNMDVKSVGPTLGKTFREQGIKAIFWAFILMSLVVFIQFKDFVPSIAVIQAAICDPLMALACMSLFGIPFNAASLGALLMLIGYSVDTDILLTARVKKFRAGDVNDNINLAMKTGLMMTSTIVVTMIIVILVTTFLIQISTLNTIAYVLMFGLIMDLFTTWFTNAGILKWNAMRPKKRRKSILNFSIFKK
jgi:preprotein translocase subunit SecF